MMVLSQVVSAAMVSTPACCCRCSARSRESERVRALWLGWTANTPAPWACSTATACTASSGRPPDAIAAATMNWRLASWSARDPAKGGATASVPGDYGSTFRSRIFRSGGVGAPGFRGRGLRVRPDGVDGGADVRGGGAAAAADQGHPGLGEPAEVAGEVVAVDAELEAARAGAPRLAGVRLRAHRHRRVPDQVLAPRSASAAGRRCSWCRAWPPAGRTARWRPRAGSRRPGCARRRRRWPGR